MRERLLRRPREDAALTIATLLLETTRAPRDG